MILLSGDIHLSEIMKTPYPEENMKYNLYEITSSGLTHTLNQFFIGSFLKNRFYNTMTFDKYKVNKYMEYSFATIEINWNNFSVRIDLRDLYGKTMVKKIINYEDLEPNNKYKKNPLIESSKFIVFYENLIDKIKGNNSFYHIFNILIIITYISFPLMLIALFLKFFIKKSYSIIRKSRKEKAK